MSAWPELAEIAMVGGAMIVAVGLSLGAILAYERIADWFERRGDNVDSGDQGGVPHWRKAGDET